MRLSKELTFCFMLLLTSLLLTAAACASTLQLDVRTTRLQLDSRFDVLEDKTGQLDVRDVMDPAIAASFTPLAGNLKAAYSRSAYWLRFSLQRSADQTEPEWWLEMSPAMLDDIRLYQPTTDGRMNEHRAGDHRPFSTQEVRHHLPVFKIYLPDNAQHVFYLRIESTSALFFRAKLSTPQAFAEDANRLSNLIGLYYGIMLAMIAYNLVLILSFRERAMLYYLLLAISTLIVSVTVNGHAGMYFAFDWPWLVDVLPGVMVSMILLSESLFIMHFLQLPAKMPRLTWLFRAIQLIAVAAIPMVLAGYNHVVAPIVQSVGFIQMLVILPICLFTALRGYRPGWILFAASAAWIVGALMSVLRNMGWMESSWLTDYGFQIGSAIEIILLALAQTDRINIIKRERELAQSQLLTMAQRAEQELEAKVKQRTEELDQAVTQLQKLDKVKNDFLGIAAHDLKNPLTSIIGMSDLLRKLDHQIPTDQRINYLERIGNNGQRMMHIITDLLDVNAFDSGHSHIELQSVNLNQVLQHVINQYEESIKAKGLHVTLSADHPVMVTADPDATAQIIDNLLSNAVKYSSPDKQIWITVSSDRNDGSIMIKDEGPGLSAQDQEKLFEKFSRLSTKPTAGEHSTGLGLSIVKKLCESMGGSVHCQSSLGAGCTFTVNLPVVQHEMRPLDA